MPKAIPLFVAVRDFICSEFEYVNIKVQRTQISFSSRYGFAFVSLPFRKVKNRPEIYIILTFGLNRRLAHPRIAAVTEPYPGRWTHHVIIQDVNEMDAEGKAWIGEAYHFSMIK